MAKVTIPVVVDSERLATAARLIGDDDVSAVLGHAVEALIAQELERRWMVAHPDTELPGEVIPDLSSIPWKG